MMNPLFLSFANLILALDQMKNALKLDKLSLIELSVYAAMIDICRQNGDETITIEELRNHPLLQSVPKPSLYRALKSLRQQGKCQHTGTLRSGTYSLHI